MGEKDGFVVERLDLLDTRHPVSVIQHQFSQSEKLPVVGLQRNLNERQVSGETNEPENDCFVGGGSHAGLGQV